MVEIYFDEKEAEEVQAAMIRCDFAVNKVRENRLNRKDADELVRATLALLNKMRVIHNSHLMESR